MADFWLHASVKIEAATIEDAKAILDRALRSECDPSKDEGIVYFDRTGLAEEENK